MWLQLGRAYEVNIDPIPIRKVGRGRYDPFSLSISVLQRHQECYLRHLHVDRASMRINQTGESFFVVTASKK